MMPNGMVAVAPAGSGVAPPEPPLEPPAVPPAEAGPGGVAGPRGRGIPRERKTLVIAAIAGVAALCLVLFLPLVRWKPVRPVSVAGLLPADSPAVTAAHQLLADWKLGAVQVAPAADGGVILTGYCETQELKERLSAALRARGLAVDNRVWPEDRLRQALAETLMRLGGPSLGYSYLGQGVVRLDGFVPPTLGRDDLLFTLRNDVPGIVRVEAAFRTLDDYLTELRGRVDQAGLTGLVTITADGSQVRAQGTLDDAQRVRWGLVAQSFHTANPAGPPLEDQVKPRPAPDAPAPAAEPLVTGIGLQGVIISADQPSRALLSDGTIVAVGDRIDARSRVQQIQFDQMVLSNGLQEQVIRLGAFNK